MKYFDEMISIINNSLQTLSPEYFTQLVNESVSTLKHGNKIIASGLGKNVPICDKFVGTMVSLGQNACFLHTNSAIHGDMGIVKENDLVILLTKSGETAESIYLAKHLKKKNANLWLLSFQRESTLSREISKQIIIDLEHEGDKWNIMPNNSTTLNLIVLQALAMEIANEMNITLESFRENHPGGHIGKILD